MAVDHWLEAERTALMTSVGVVPQLHTLLAALSAGPRTKGAFEGEVNRFVGKAKPRVLMTVLHHLSAAGRSTLNLVAHNDGGDNLDALVVEFDLPPGAYAIGRWSDISPTYP